MIYESWFSYGIHRPYPYRWFTPIVIVGGLVAVVVFSIINIASSGYNSTVLYSSDPNATVTENWYKGLPLIFGNAIKPSCQPKEILPNEAFQTNNSALTYTLNQVTQRSSGSGNFDTFAPTFIYSNNYLGNCDVHEIQVLVSSTDLTAAQSGFSAWGTTVQGRVSCVLSLKTEPLKVDLTANYNLIPETVSILSGFSVFNGLNRTATPSMFWAECLLANNWENLTRTLNQENSFHYSSKGTISFTHSALTKNVTSLDYFLTDLRVLNPSNDTYSIYYTKPNMTTNSVLSDYGDFVVATDSLAKVMEAAIMTDLAQTSWDVDNIFTSPELLRTFFNNQSSQYSGYLPGLAIGGPQDFSDDIPLGFVPSVISTTYLCEVPMRKGWANLIVSLIVADLVFLRALWAVFCFIVGHFQSRHYPDANSCEGCRKISNLDEYHSINIAAQQLD
ncbi:hypothetical protein F5Y12DRAFT_793587 [Xylaria sp. FL1777]|nr:hypothetical protein F5Y12DRAFT_793587 [Xylaria sp. FL1777]